MRGGDGVKRVNGGNSYFSPYKLHCIREHETGVRSNNISIYLTNTVVGGKFEHPINERINWLEKRQLKAINKRNLNLGKQNMIPNKRISRPGNTVSYFMKFLLYRKFQLK